MSYQQFERMNFSSPAPRAFAGKYPTRVRIIALKGSVPISYSGKPVPALKEWIGRRFLLLGGNPQHLGITEFDQNGIIRQLVNGELRQSATFADLYFPMPAMYWEYLSVAGKILVFLDRELKIVDQRPVYVNKFWKDTEWKEEAYRMVQDLCHARFGRRYFVGDATIRVADFIDQHCVRPWMRPVVTPPRRPDRTPRSRTRQVFIDQHIQFPTPVMLDTPTEPEPPDPTIAIPANFWTTPVREIQWGTTHE